MPPAAGAVSEDILSPAAALQTPGARLAQRTTTQTATSAPSRGARLEKANHARTWRPNTPERLRPPSQVAAPGLNVSDREVLSVAVGARRHRLRPTLENDRHPAGGHEPVLVVQLRQEAVTPPPLYGV